MGEEGDEGVVLWDCEGDALILLILNLCTNPFMCYVEETGVWVGTRQLVGRDGEPGSARKWMVVHTYSQKGGKLAME